MLTFLRYKHLQEIYISIQLNLARDDRKLPGDSGEVPISEWSGWEFESGCEVFSLLDGKKKKTTTTTTTS